ncbi:uncharacterized protein LOC126572527 [Anopheles aquasalis]|uniref:uncharacterized protein LOC126572527 n=1 Tax=Anopheles aquasalis TaxID=42839 RepID=UPI00215AC0CA|nr:uncharacterized protein LOC126572527 [Anopheles aquasalis]
MCEILHNIEVTNVQATETFHHSIALLKGSISNPCEGTELRISFNEQQDQHRPLSYSYSADVGESFEKLYKFRLLVRLAEGENGITLRYCKVERRFSFHYVPRCSPYTVVPLYIICKGHSGRYQSHVDDQENTATVACQKITLAIELLQCLYGEKLHEEGYGRKTFTLGSSCVPFHSQLEWTQSVGMTEGELWQHFASELVQSEQYDMATVKVVAFLSSTHFEGITDGDYSYGNIRAKTTGHAALGGGGLALFGTGCLYTWPTTLERVGAAFLNPQPVDCANLLDDSNYRRTYGGCYATTLGSVCHEMGHTFDLGHTPDGSIMGDGFDGIERVFVAPKCPGGDTGPRRLVETKPRGPAGRLTQLKRPTDVFRQRMDAKCNDGIFFAPNSANTLNYHRWFQLDSAPPGANGATILFDRDTRLVSSEGTGSALVLVELRLSSNGMMQKFWTFQCGQKSIPQAQFQLPKLSNLSDHTLFVMNAVGDILKVNLATDSVLNSEAQ